MGNELSRDAFDWTVPHLRGYPDPRNESKYDPLYGFPKGRKERVSIATEAEMESAQLIDSHRDYCAHHAIKWQACMRDNYPFTGKCAHYKENWHECQHNE